MADTDIGLWGSISSFFIVVLGLLGFRSQINNLDRTKVEKDAFKEFKEAQSTEHKDLKINMNKLFEKIDQVYKDMPKRNGDSG